MTKKSKLRKDTFSGLSSLFKVFDGDYRNEAEALMMEETNPNNPKSAANIICALLVPSFYEYLASSQKLFLSEIEFLLKDETEDFSELFNFHLQGGVFFGEDLVETRQFVEVAYDILKKEYEKKMVNNNI